MNPVFSMTLLSHFATSMIGTTSRSDKYIIITTTMSLVHVAFTNSREGNGIKT